MSWDRVHAEAEVLEHVLSEELEELIAGRLGDPAVDPHGDPIPTPLFEIDERPTRSLDELAVGAAGRFVRVSDSDPEMLRYLAELGMALGTRLEVVDRQPFGGPVFVRFGEREHPIGGELARAMRIETDGGPALTPPPGLRSPRLRAPAPARPCRCRRGTRGERARTPALAREGPLDAVHARSRVRGLDRVRRPRQLRDQRAGRRRVRLPAAVGRAGGEPGRDGDPVPVGQDRDRHRPQLPRGRPRALPARVHLGNVGASRDHGDVDRHRRVPRRCDRPEPAVRRAAVRRRADDRRDRVRDPRAPGAGLPQVRARDQRPARDHLRRLPLRDAADRAVRARLAARADPQHATAPPTCTSRSGSSARP